MVHIIFVTLYIYKQVTTCMDFITFYEMNKRIVKLFITSENKADIYKLGKLSWILDGYKLSVDYLRWHHTFWTRKSSMENRFIWSGKTFTFYSILLSKFIINVSLLSKIVLGYELNVQRRKTIMLVKLFMNQAVFSIC